MEFYICDFTEKVNPACIKKLKIEAGIRNYSIKDEHVEDCKRCTNCYEVKNTLKTYDEMHSKKEESKKEG